MANWYRHGWPGGHRKADDRLITQGMEGASGLAIIVYTRRELKSQMYSRTCSSCSQYLHLLRANGHVSGWSHAPISEDSWNN